MPVINYPQVTAENHIRNAEACMAEADLQISLAQYHLGEARKMAGMMEREQR